MYIYIYIYISGDSSLFLLFVPPTVNFSSQPVVQSKSSELLLRDSPLYSTD